MVSSFLQLIHAVIPERMLVLSCELFRDRMVEIRERAEIELGKARIKKFGALFSDYSGTCFWFISSPNSYLGKVGMSPRLQPCSRAGVGGRGCVAAIALVASSDRRNARSPDAVSSGIDRLALAAAAVGSKVCHAGSVLANGRFVTGA
jgi:hypothetical protein